MKRRNLAVTAVSALMIAATVCAPMSAFAESAYGGMVEKNQDTELVEYFVLKNKASIQEKSPFEYTFGITTPAKGVAATEELLAVVPGVGAPTFKESNKIEFTKDDSINHTIPEANAVTNGDTPHFKTEDTTDEKYIKKSVKVDFSGITFPEPGVYRYLISENDNNVVKTLDVYVYNAVDDNGDPIVGEDGKQKLEIGSYVMYDGVREEGAQNLDEIKEKDNTITHDYDTYDLTFGKIVTGNQGSKDKYFKFTLDLTNVKSGNVYAVDLTNAEETVTVNGVEYTNPATITVPDDATSVSTVFYLKHGQYVTVNTIEDGSSYEVSEENEDYASKAGIEKSLSTLNWDGVEGNDALTDLVTATNVTEDVHTGYVNDKTGKIPTGVLSTVKTSAGVIFLGLAGLAAGALSLKKKKED